MKKGATTVNPRFLLCRQIIALRNEKGSYNTPFFAVFTAIIIALRNEKGSYNCFNKAK